MDSQNPKDPLDILQLMVTDVLVQTGKALRASRRDETGPPTLVHGSLQSKLPETIRTFHSALDDLENDIIRAKSVLLRDLSEIQARRNPPVQAPEPVEAQTKSPMVIDIESSPPADLNRQSLMQTNEVKQMAPFPDMGLDPSEGMSTVPAKDDTADSQTPTVGQEGDADIKVENIVGNSAPAAAMAPMPIMDEPALDVKPGAPQPDMTTDLQDPQLNFTDMAFTLAQNNDHQENQDSKHQEPNFDLSTFAPPENGDQMSLDSLLPTKTDQPAAPTEGQNTDIEMPSQEDAKKEGGGDGLDHVYDFDPGVQDGTDFDFSLPGNMGEDTFDDLMNSRDQNFDLMEPDDLDAAFFGLDKNET